MRIRVPPKTPSTYFESEASISVNLNRKNREGIITARAKESITPCSDSLNFRS
jgi:hypothetical protein